MTMFERDILMRQIQQMIDILTQVLLHRRADEPYEAREALAHGIRECFGLDIETLRGLPREEVMALCASDRTFSGEMAVALADLLREDESPGGWRRALWLYEEALTSEAAVPIDIQERIAELHERLE